MHLQEYIRIEYIYIYIYVNNHRFCFTSGGLALRGAAMCTFNFKVISPEKN